MAFDVYLLSRWLGLGAEADAARGSTLPYWMRMSIDIRLVVGWVLCAIVIYLFLIRPWIRKNQLTLDGMFVIAVASLYWQDSLQNAGAAQSPRPSAGVALASQGPAGWQRGACSG